MRRKATRGGTLRHRSGSRTLNADLTESPFAEKNSYELSVSPQLNRKVRNFKQFHKITLPGTHGHSGKFKAAHDRFTGTVRERQLLRKSSSKKFSEFHELYLEEVGLARSFAEQREQKKKSVAIKIFEYLHETL